MSADEMVESAASSTIDSQLVPGKMNGNNNAAGSDWKNKLKVPPKDRRMRTAVTVAAALTSDRSMSKEKECFRT